MAMFHLLKIRTSIDIFKKEECKVTFGLEYINGEKAYCIKYYIFLDGGIESRDSTIAYTPIHLKV